jgi:hypothetical protein
LFQRHLELSRQFVPPAGEPIFSLHWFLSWYAGQLPPLEREEFENMRVRELLQEPPEESLGKAWVQRLSEQGKWRLASSTAALWTKRPE